MQQKDCKKTFTYQTRLPILTEKEDLFLSQTATLLSKVERTLFADFSKAKKLNDLKSIYLEKFSITARQFNSCRISLEGKIRSYQEGLKERISLLKTKIQKLEKHVKSCKDPSKKHQKKRRLFILKTTQKNLEKDQEEGKVRICFGGKNLFHQQFHLEENGFTQFSEWKKTWQEKRNNQFFLIGSKDETAGNQSCQLSKEGGLFTLHLRLPNGFSEKTLAIKGIDFSYGKEEIEQALEENEKRRNLRLAKQPYTDIGRALNYRFLKDKKGWRFFISLEQRSPAKKSKNALGTIGIDINANHLALAETDRFGNIIEKKSIPCSTYGKSTNARLAIIGDVSKEIVEYALQKEKPLVLEDLNFQKKKQTLRESNNKYSRLLSSFSYSQILSHIESKAFREGIEIYHVNPAYTTIIGEVKFTKRYGLSKHHAAAFVIARRKDGFSEKPPRYLEIDTENSKSAFSQPVWKTEKHVWCFYRALSKKKKAAHAVHLPTKRSSKQLRDSRKASVDYG